MKRVTRMIVLFLSLVCLSSCGLLEKELPIISDIAELGTVKTDKITDDVTRTVTIIKFKPKEYFQNKTRTYPFSQAEVTIFYKVGKALKPLLHTQFNQQGELKNELLKDVPQGVQTLYFSIKLGNKKMGYITQPNNSPYNFVIPYTITDKTSEINDEFLTSFKQSEKKKLAFRYHSANRALNYYVQVYEDQVASVSLAKKILNNKTDVRFKPIDIVWEYDFEKGRGNGFYRKGYQKAGKPNIVVRNGDNFEDDYLLKEILHEWAHWNMFCLLGDKMAPQGYQKHNTYNDITGVSYKEGWALFQTTRYNNGYHWAKRHDLQVQTLINDDGMPIYGRSTNKTVRGILMDLFDKSNVDETFDITQSFKLDTVTLAKKSQLAEGIMYLAMIESKATTLAEYLTYIETNYVNTANEKKRYQLLLKINGLSDVGEFTLGEIKEN
ncbi:hypothetical protein [Vagococcus intermedius]|uniref:Lipoprotein n=1 Tax=Vagococcus intermedius TaxID=2991418 RepID=A0AAF0CTC9_9ENTE|nr:hypothetical protein [Vagococcus intermedius]WEG72477.1 hypothetical protein OL234_05680 [Vagococcus intermedius]WEG74564.1 hypothetical protein OL235_05685 [Vagococcus intermedius]